ncbi:hypothetical protein DL762_007340 [Monosporascus cannonballus]|uniref:FAD-binding PCMH-type domain-containing protein n=1 Tax=Monosporascus cannonballus TaxID=155416 RepID=A0ABY0GZG4_9PEZI|nr:hypothetical protein DL762_007340 [Monosporascus cannonballus]
MKVLLIIIYILFTQAYGYEETADFDVLQRLKNLGVDIFDNDKAANRTLDCSFACDSLSWSFGSVQVAQAGQSSFEKWLSEFWSAQQSDTFPACLFRPSSSEEAAAAVLLARLTQCEFAVKSGGPASFAGASNRRGGLTIDLASLNEVIVTEDRRVASIGPGNRWYDVYLALEPENLTAVGGRVASVGVGGLTLGGGISFFSNLYGWACDNIVNYEVITASGDIINANATSNPDLFWALRGGGNNFGLVTHLNAYVYPQGLMWGGDRVFPIAMNSSLIRKFVDWGRGQNGSVEDPNGAVIISYSYDTGSATWRAVNSLEYAIPQADDNHPAAFDSFFDMPNPVYDSTTTKYQSQLTLDWDAAGQNGFRQTFWTLSFVLDERIISEVLQIWYEETEPLTRLDFTVQFPALAIQVITLSQIKYMSRAGGNALGLPGTGEPLLIVNWTYMWDKESEDGKILEAYARILSRAKAAGERLGVNHRYIYQNYASQAEDPIDGYGPESKAKLLAVSQKYDPTGVFQRLQPGYFKLKERLLSPSEAKWSS